MGQFNRQREKHRNTKALVALFLSFSAWPVLAVDLGRLQVLSAIGEPLRAEIEIAQASPEELRTFRAQLAPPGAFNQAGMEFNTALNGVTASLQTRSNGSAFIALNGRLPIQENFLDLILETQWSTGKLVKNYALLLNSVRDRNTSAAPSAQSATRPTFAAVPIALNEPPISIQPLNPVSSQATIGELNATSVEVNAQNVPVYRFAAVDNAQSPNASSIEPVVSRSTQQTAPAVQANPNVRLDSIARSSNSITVRPGDTASQIALRFLGANVSLDQMMLAMLKANPDAFIQGNVNLVKAGAVLRMPETEDATQIDRTEARKAVIAQTRDFAEYAKRLAESPLLVDSKNSRVMSGKVTSETVKPATESVQQNKLTLSKPGVETGAAEGKMAAQREAKDATDQLSALNKNLKDLEALAQKPSSSNAPAGTVSSPPGPLSSTNSTAGALPGSPPSKAPMTSPLSLVEDKQLWAWAGGLLAMLLLLVFWMRRKSAEPESVYAPSYDDMPTPNAEPTMVQAPVHAGLSSRMNSIDLNLSPQVAPASPGSSQSYAAQAPVASSFASASADDTEQSKLNLAAQLLSKGDKDLARALVLSVVSSTQGELKARAIQMLGQIR